ncbi:MAG TPA: UDP-N-acetylmuramate:L-alanyl-gamma-D-glutamyl-meso-diaminopimelate ligase [Desulfobulbus sp.]|nr:UDP-N-acetylmuramate:L-alanyl-gamma-D-glutamyl-meso-diaminopimelate ligase [Desulfobulbus sp.]
MSDEARLDPALNRLPAGVHHIHVMGICGTGMAALAGMLQDEGFRVTGSDSNVYPPMSDFLAGAGIDVLDGYDARNLEPRPDLVIVGNVIRAVNPEAVRLAELEIPYLSMPQALAAFFLQARRPLVVAGTHGKTTTSSLLATALHRAGAGPGFMIGGIVEAFGRNSLVGSGPWFVVEGDEYDTAFFNKVSKFLHYRPHCAILTSIEFDHADIFSDLDMIRDSFARFVRLIPEDGALVACLDDPVVAGVAGLAACPVISYGTGDQCCWQLRDLEVEGLNSRFSVVRDGRLYGRFTLPMPGLHNGLNALAVIALMDHLGVGVETIGIGLASFEGVRRRQQVRGTAGGVTVIDDFAHHPTAVRETVRALRLAWPDRRLIVVFEPRTNSSRRAIFQDQYAGAFDGADLVVVREHVPLDNVPAGEQFSSSRLVRDLEAQGKQALYFPDTDAILDHLGAHCRQGDVVAILSNGGFDNIHQRLLSRLR